RTRRTRGSGPSAGPLPSRPASPRGIARRTRRTRGSIIRALPHTRRHRCLAGDPMRSSIFLGLAACLLAAAPVRAATALPGPAFPAYPDARALQADCDRSLAVATQRLHTLERHPPDARWAAASDDLNAYIEDASPPVSLIENV